MNRELRCVECKHVFTFTDKEQAFYSSHRFPDPIRCPRCRKAIKLKREERQAELDEAKVVRPE